ncbi:hypothetical protein DEU52_106122 [Ensifer adhaerens]|nr:hypothetical protein DEU52_106122 [Ensifer adhaerens]
MVIHTLHITEPGGTVAKQETDLVPFISLGEVTHAVILRLSSDLPRIRCETPSTGGETGRGLA